MKLAIIGASKGQSSVCIKAREIGLETVCFAWEKGAVCRDLVDKYYNISVMDTDAIVDICKKERVSGIVTNASDLLAEQSAIIAEKLHLNGTPSNVIRNIRDKSYVRRISQTIEGVAPIWFSVDLSLFPPKYPCVVKPITGSSKAGVAFARNNKEYIAACEYAKALGGENILIEEFVEGKEISVETISFRGQHYIIQYTDKETSGPPHFVEIAHHQPSAIQTDVKNRIAEAVKVLLNKLGYTDGAAHIELKINDQGQIFLIEMNPRGGGDNISDTLTMLSSGYDYIKGMIDVALGSFSEPLVTNAYHSGIYYLCSQTKDLIPFIENASNQPWYVSSELPTNEINEATGNYDRSGFVIYRWKSKVIPTSHRMK